MRSCFECPTISEPGFRDVSPTADVRMEKHMEHEMDVWIGRGSWRLRSPPARIKVASTSGVMVYWYTMVM